MSKHVDFLSFVKQPCFELTNVSLITDVGSDSWALVVLRRQILKAYMSLRDVGYVHESLKMEAHPNFIDFTMWNRKCLYEFRQEEE